MPPFNLVLSESPEETVRIEKMAKERDIQLTPIRLDIYGRGVMLVKTYDNDAFRIFVEIMRKGYKIRLLPCDQKRLERLFKQET